MGHADSHVARDCDDRPAERAILVNRHRQLAVDGRVADERLYPALVLGDLAAHERLVAVAVEQDRVVGRLANVDAREKGVAGDLASLHRAPISKLLLALESSGARLRQHSTERGRQPYER